jgi:hypothetical protein
MIVTIFYHVDNFCKKFEEKLLPNKKPVGPKPRMTLSEIMTIAIYFHYSKLRTFKDYYQHIRVYYREYFNRLVSYNRFVELMQTILVPLTMFQLFCLSFATKTGIYFIDSTKLVICHNKRIYSHKIFKGLAQRGKDSTGWFYGFKLHFIINENGEIMSFALTPGNISDKNMDLVDQMTKDLIGRMFGDRGYVSQPLFEKLASRGLKLFTTLRKNMKGCLVNLTDKLMQRKRGLIETVNNVLKNTFYVEHSRHRNVTNFVVNVISGLLAYFFKPDKPSIYTALKYIENSDV